MSVHDLKYCPGTLAKGFSTYSPACLRNLFDGKKVSHILPYDPPQQNEDTTALFIDNRKRISISGVQEKMSLRLEKNILRLTERGEQGNYILKPIPRDLKKVDQLPANEHLSMQIARQVYGIHTAENAIIFFKNGTPAYITKRFDVKTKGVKWAIEDFASLAGKTKDNAGFNFKYEYSYEEIGELIKKFVPAWRVEIEKYFSLLVFNYLISNGDAHLKNFSLLESSNGDYLLSPAYDLVNTKIHVDDTDFALSRGLFKDGYKSEHFEKTGHPSKSDFFELACRMGISESRYKKLMLPFVETQNRVSMLIDHSYLNDAIKRGYLLDYQTKRNFLDR